ncbi:amidase domain-containing protein [Agromyces aerolatus]|uniref:amidase domain-containing protein n=1 Tax=Agromyces sp. LY-1074 TaxID=3074080 RepID=UPI002854742C|nr:MULTISPECIES: amidase domain-containing protein [unclassified Agromyces]MDR5700526.1 amidase domain-containing protein [Agromyces sp. LY-1074]MDR5707047.1 amidase domain-containing protein [Agromyces sp. LY-1358]
MNQDSPAPRRRSSFRPPGSVDAEALTRLFGEASAAELAAQSAAEASGAAAAEAAAPGRAAPDAGAPSAAAPDPAAPGSVARAQGAGATSASAPGARSGRRASSRPVDDLGPKHRAARPANRRAAGDVPPAVAPAGHGSSRQADASPAQAAPVEPMPTEGAPRWDQATPVESMPTEAAPMLDETATVAPVPVDHPRAAHSDVELGEPTVLRETLSAEDASAEDAPAEDAPAEDAPAEPVPADPATFETSAATPLVDEPAGPLTELLETSFAAPAPTPAEPAPAEPTPAEPAPAEPVRAEPTPAEAAPAPLVADSGSAPEPVPLSAEAPSRARAVPAGPSSHEPAAFPWNLTPEAPIPVEHRRSSSPAARRPRRPRHRLAVGVSAAAVLVVTGLGALAVANDVPASLFAATTPASPAPSDAVAGTSEPTITSDLSEAAAPFTGGTSITVTGERLDAVAQVSVAGTPADILEASADHLTFAVPATTGDAIGAAEVVFADGEGRPVTVSVPSADASASAEASAGAEPGGSSEASAPATDARTGSLTLTYTSDPGIDAQLAYVLEYWDDYNTAEYPAVTGKDAVNFASQSLIARGWTMDDAWNVDSATGAMSAAWSSSTSLRDYLLTRTDRATELTDAQRDQVKVGDLAQFDWDGSGDRDHTAVVTRVERTDAGTKVWVASHTKDADYWDVDAALASGGGSVSWFSIR